MPLCTFFRDESGVDIGCSLVEKTYIMDVYPSLAETVKVAGLFTWGIGTCGRLGNGSAAGQQFCPAQTISRGSNWKSVPQYSTGILVCHSAAIKSDGTLWMWGINNYGQLGTNTVVSHCSPVQTVSGGTNWKQVSLGREVSAAIKTDGTLWTWGRNAFGNLGTNVVGNRSSPVQTVSGGTNWRSVSVGQFTMGGIKTDGTLWTWGRNYVGELGTNNTVPRSSPVQTISGGNDWRMLWMGNCHVTAIKTNGTLWVWGTGNCGGLGTNDVICRSSPVQTVAGGTNWCWVTATDSQTYAIKTDGTLWSWGFNANQMLGTGNNISRSSPAQTLILGKDWKKVIAGAYAVHAIKRDGTMWSTGFGNNGQLGQNFGGTFSCFNRGMVTGLFAKGWKDVSAGRYGGLGIIENNDW